MGQQSPSGEKSGTSRWSVGGWGAISTRTLGVLLAVMVAIAGASCSKGSASPDPDETPENSSEDAATAPVTDASLPDTKDAGPRPSEPDASNSDDDDANTDPTDDSGSSEEDSGSSDEAGNDDCTEQGGDCLGCCANAHDPQAFDTTFQDCACHTQCGGVCANTYCSSKSQSPSAGSPCDRCLRGATQCRNAGRQACAKDPECALFMQCADSCSK